MNDVTKKFELHAARAFFASAWADAVEESEDSPIVPGVEIMDTMPAEIDPAATHAAQTLRVDIERANVRTIAQLLDEIEAHGDGDRANTAEHFGHYAAMQAMGHGVGLFEAFGSEIYDVIRVPSVEFGPHSLGKDYF